MRYALAGLFALVSIPARAAEPLPEGAVARLGNTKFRVAAPFARTVVLSPDGKAAAFRVEDGIDVMNLDTGEVAARIRDAKRLTDPKWSRGPHYFSFAFAPGGKEIVTATAEEEAWVWDAATGKPLRSIKGPDYQGFTEGGKKETAKVVRVTNLQLADFVLCETWGGLHKLDVKSGRWTPTGGLYDDLEDVSPDGRWAAGSTDAASIENYVDLADLTTGKQVYEGGAAGDGFPYGHTPSPDGKYVAYSALKAGVQVVNVATKKDAPLKKVDPNRPSARLRFTPDGKTLLAVLPDSIYDYDDPPHIARWDVASGERLVDWKLPIRLDTWAVDHRNNRLVVVAGQGVFLVDLATGKITPPPDGFLGHPRPAISADGKFAAVGDTVGVIRLYEAPFDKEPRTLRAGGLAVEDLVFSADGKALFASYYDRTVGAWDVATGKETATLKAPVGRGDGPSWYRTLQLAVSPDGKTLAGEANAQAVWAWDIATGKVLWRLDAGERGRGITGCRPVFSPDGTVLYYGREKAQVSRFDPRTGREQARVVVPGMPGGYDVTGLAVSPDGKRFAAVARYNDGYLVAFDWELKSVAFPKMFTHDDALGGLAFSGDGSLAVTVHADGTVRGWPADRLGKPSFTLKGPAGYVSRMQLTSDAKFAITNPPGATALVWKLPAR